MSSNVKKYSPPQRETGERFSILEMSWWFDHQNFNHRENLEGFFKLLEEYLPEALPRKYGLYEPPQFKYEETGLNHLVDFLLKEKSIVTATTKPVLGISFGLNEASGFVQHGTKKKYKCSDITISIDADVLCHFDWQEYLPQIWKELSLVIQPFYGDVRVLKNYLSSKTTYRVDGETEQHPVKSWWWRGIPEGLSLAAVIGRPYIELCPEIRSMAKEKKSLHFLSHDKWDCDADSINLMNVAPKEIFQPEATSGYNLAATFPFKDQSNT